MPAPQADTPRCDVPGCGRVASQSTDGTEKDAHVQKIGSSTDNDDGIGKVIPMTRPSLPCLNTCEKHANWPHSDDARAWTEDPKNAPTYRARLAALGGGAKGGKK